MYQITINQKEQLLNRILKAYEKESTKKSDKKFLLSVYREAQYLSHGQSLSPKKAVKLKNIFKKVAR